MIVDTDFIFSDCLNFYRKGEIIIFLYGEVAMNVIDNREWLRKLCNFVLLKKLINFRFFIYMIVVVVVCFGVCVVVFYINKVSKFVVIIRRCLFDKFV